MKKEIQYQGHSIAYQSQGTGQAIVFIHGFMEDRSMWQYHYQAMSAHHKCIAIDLPGHGASDMLSEVHSMPLMAAVVQAVLQAEGVEKAVLIGHSMGGYVAVAMAQESPQFISGLVLFNSHVAADNPQHKNNRLRTIALVENNCARFIAAFIPDLFAPANRERCAAIIQRQQKIAKAMPPAAIVAALKGMMQRRDGVATLAQLPCPVLFIRGAQDNRIDMASLQQQLDVCEPAHLLCLPFAGHMAWAEAPEATLECLSDFVRLI